MVDDPIVPQDYIGGVKVVDIGDVRVARGMSRRHTSSCPHHKLNYDTSERRVWCADCEADVDNFDAFRILVEQFNDASKTIQERRAKLANAEQSNLRSLAARELDKAWCRRSMIPACPSCGSGLFPEDFKNGVRSMVGREYAEAQRKRRQQDR